MRKYLRLLLLANLCLWIYFGVAFAHASQPYDPRPWGHVPVDLYTFWGHSIGLTKSSLEYPFMEVIFWVQFPSFLLATLIQRVFFGNVSADRFFLGISIGGYKLLAVLLLSFAQWYFIGWAIPDSEAEGASHTQLGTRQSRSKPGTSYPQAREFDANGKPVRDIDFTDHGRPKEHTNPHEHPYDPSTGARGKAQPVTPPPPSSKPCRQGTC